MQAVQPTATTMASSMGGNHQSHQSHGGGGGPQPAGLPTALSSFRYAPYPMPVSAAALSASQAVQQALAAQQQQQQQQQQIAPSQGQPQQPQQQVCFHKIFDLIFDKCFVHLIFSSWFLVFGILVTLVA